MRQGRAFTAQDTAQTRTAIVNESLAVRLTGANPVGTRVWSNADAYEIVGVVADYANASTNARTGQPRIYLPVPNEPSSASGAAWATSVAFMPSVKTKVSKKPSSSACRSIGMPSPG